MEETGAAAEATTGKLDAVAASGAAAGRRMSSIGHNMTALAVPLLAIGGYAVKTAADFQTSMTKLRTQVGVSTGEITQMSKAVTTLAPQVGEGPTALAAALYPIESVGLRGAAALSALRAAAMGAQISGASLTDTADAVSGALRTQMHDVHSATDAMSIMNGIVAQGKMQLSDLTAAMATGILPSAKSAGLGFRDVGDALAAMTRQGIPASAEATRLRLTLTQMEAPSSTALKALASVGLGQFSLADDLRKPNGLITALLDLRTHLQGLSKDQQNLILSEAFGHSKGSQNVIGLMNALPQMQQIQQPLAAAGTDQLMQAFGLRQKDIGFQWDKLKAQAQVALIAIGNALMPIVQQLLPVFVDGIKAVAHWFVQLSGPVKVAVVAFTLLLGIGGPVLIFLGAVATAFGTLATVVGVVVAAMAALDIVIAPWFLLALAVAAVVIGLYELYTHFTQVFNAIKSVVSSVANYIGQEFELAVHNIVTAFNAVVGFFGTVASAIGHAFSGIGNFIAGVMGDVVNTIVDAINWVIGKLNWLVDQYNSVIGSIPVIGGDLTVGHIGTIGHVNWGAASPSTGGQPSSQSIGSQPANSVNQTGHSTTPTAPIVLHHTTKIGQRVVAEETVHYTAKRTSLGAAPLAGH